MKRRNIAACVEYALLCIGIAGIFMIPDDNSPTWIADLLLTKAVAVAAFLALGILIKREPWKV